jgi:hypothetical protein
MKKQTVAGLPCHERVLRADGGQSAPQVRDMGAQGDVRACGRLPTPQRVGDPARCYAAVQVDQQDGKQFALLASTEPERLPPVGTGG